VAAGVTSAALFERARAVVPGGVNSPVRAFRAVGGTPRFVARGQGPYLYDVDGREYVDLVCSWGPLLLGHAHPDVLAAVHAAVAAGTSYGAPTEGEVALAEEIVAEVAGGGSLAARGLVTTRYSGFLRSGYIDGAPQEIVATAFRTAPGKAAVVDAGDRVHIVQVTAVQPADPAGAEQKRVTDAIAEQARQGLAQDLYAFYAQALEARDGIVLDPAAIEAVHAQIR